MEPGRKTDGELLAEFVAGKGDEPFAEIVRRHGAMVLRTCRRLGLNRQDAEDAAQLVFTTLTAKAATLAACRSLGGWLYSTAWHVASRTRRAQATRRHYERQAARTAAAMPDVPCDDEMLWEIYRAMEMLPPDYRDAIVLHHLEGLTIEQIGAVMNCSAGTAAARLSRARAQIRDRLRWRNLFLSASLLDAALLEPALLTEPVAPAATAPVAPPAEIVPHVPSLSAAMPSSSIGASAGIGRRGLKFLARKKVMASMLLLAGTTAAAGVAEPAIVRKVLQSVRHADADDAPEKVDPIPLTFGSRETADIPAVLPVPEPASLSLLALSPFLLRRRRH